MGWKDLMKNVTDKATSIAETAQEKLEEQKQLSAIKKEEQNKKMEEMNERVTEYEQELLQNIVTLSRIKIVGDIQVKGYIIQLPVQSNKIGGDGVKDYEEVLEERRKRINKPRQVIKDEYVEDDFFSIDDDDDLDFPEDWK